MMQLEDNQVTHSAHKALSACNEGSQLPNTEATEMTLQTEELQVSEKQELSGKADTSVMTFNKTTKKLKKINKSRNTELISIVKIS